MICLNGIGMRPKVRMLISVLLPSPHPQPRREEVNGEGTCDSVAQKGKTFENVLEGQAVRPHSALTARAPASSSNSG